MRGLRGRAVLVAVAISYLEGAVLLVAGMATVVVALVGASTD